jgi:hypothetical protein
MWSARLIQMAGQGGGLDEVEGCLTRALTGAPLLVHQLSRYSIGRRRPNGRSSPLAALLPFPVLAGLLAFTANLGVQGAEPVDPICDRFRPRRFLLGIAHRVVSALVRWGPGRRHDPMIRHGFSAAAPP